MEDTASLTGRKFVAESGAVGASFRKPILEGDGAAFDPAVLGRERDDQIAVTHRSSRKRSTRAANIGRGSRACLVRACR